MSETQRITPELLRTFFRPRSVALVGATDNSRWSLWTFENLQRFQFSGPVHLVHPSREIVHGQRAVKSLQDIAEPVDLAFIMVPTQRVLSVVREAAEMGTRQFVVLTSGFSEMGEEGARLEHELLAFAHERNLLILGPNGNGFINVTDNITPYGLSIAPPLISGPVGVVLQSGALASSVLAFSQAHAIGLSLLVSMGNESMFSVTDVVDYLLDDDATRAIALFLESIRQPEELRRVALKARERGKPIVALKIGRSETSARTALAHTGALVGNDEVNDAVFRQLGIIRVQSLEDLLITAGLAGYHGPLPGRRMGVVTPSGGACDIISDVAHEHDIALPAFAPQTIEQLRTVLPAFSTAHNPLDVTGYIVVDASIQRRALEIVGNDPNIDFVLNLVSIEGAYEVNPATLPLTYTQYDGLVDALHTVPCPVVLVSNTCVDITATTRLVIERTGLHFVGGIEHGIRAISRLLWWSEFMRTSPEAQEQALPAVPQTAFPRTGVWSEGQARTLLQDAGVPLIPAMLAISAQEAVQAARQVGFPVVLKIQSQAIAHKSDVGGVALHLDGEDAVQEAYDKMIERVQKACPGAKLDGVLVSPMRSAGTELLVGIIRDPLWGPVLTLGLGGIWTEVLRDTSVRVLPVSPEEIETMLSELRGFALLRGGRGQAGVDMHALSSIIHRISALALALGPQLSALEINPLWARETQIEALDALISWQ